MRTEAQADRILAKLSTLLQLAPEMRAGELIDRAGIAWHTDDDTTEQRLDGLIARLRQVGYRRKGQARQIAKQSARRRRIKTPRTSSEDPNVN